MHFYKIFSHDVLDDIAMNDKDSNEDSNEDSDGNSDGNSMNADAINNNEKKSLINKTNKECLICLEKYFDTSREKTHRLYYLIKNNHTDVIKECECDCLVHNTCLTIWFSKNVSCIICRKKMYTIENSTNNYMEIHVNINNEYNTINNFNEVQPFIRCINFCIVHTLNFIYIIKHILRMFTIILAYIFFMYFFITILDNFIKLIEK